MRRHKGSLTNHVYRDAHGLVIVYDICSKESYDAVKTWHSLAKVSNGDITCCVYIVISTYVARALEFYGQ